MNCQDALDLLYDIIDKEASEVDVKQVKEHLENCRDCFEKYRLEQSVQDFIDEKLKASNAVGVAESLKIRILDRLDDIDREDSARGEPRFFRLTTRTLVAAASLVVLIGAGLLLASFYRHNDLYIPLEEAHWSVSDNMSTYQNAEITSQLVSAVSRDYSYNISGSVCDFAMVGGNRLLIMGTEMCHFVYAKEEVLVSVFVVPADEFEIPPDLKNSTVKNNDITFFDHNCRGCRLLYHQAGPLIIITASTNHDVGLVDFVPGLSAI